MEVSLQATSPAPFQEYRAPKWLPGGHAQTIYPLLIKPELPAYRRERRTTARANVQPRRQQVGVGSRGQFGERNGDGVSPNGVLDHDLGTRRPEVQTENEPGPPTAGGWGGAPTWI